MDNLAHTLVGAALGRAIAGHRIRGAVLEMAGPVHFGDRAESPLSRLAGVVRPAAVPALEQPLVLRRLGGDRRSRVLARAARDAAVGRAAPLAAGARWAPDSGGCRLARPLARRRRGRMAAAPHPRRVGARRGGLGAPLVRRRGAATGGGIWTARAGPLRRSQRRREPAGEGAR